MIMKVINIFVCLMIIFVFNVFADALKVPTERLMKSGRSVAAISNIAKYPSQSVLRSDKLIVHARNVAFGLSADSIYFSQSYLESLNIIDEIMYTYQIDSVGFDDPDSIAYITGTKKSNYLDSTFSKIVLLNEPNYNVADSIGFMISDDYEINQQFEISVMFDIIARGDFHGNTLVSFGIPFPDTLTLFENDTLESVADTLYSVTFNAAYSFKSLDFINVHSTSADSCQFIIMYQLSSGDGWMGNFNNSSSAFSIPNSVCDSVAYNSGTNSSLNVSMVMNQYARILLIGNSWTGNVVFEKVKLNTIRQ